MTALVRSGRAPLDRIVAITFTEKAAGELKLGLIEEIEAAMDEAKSDEEREVAAEIAGERVLEDTWDAWFDARMAARPTPRLPEATA